METPEYAQFVRRISRAYAEHVGDGDPEDLIEMIRVYEEFEERVGQAISLYLSYGLDENRNRRQRTWAALGRALGVTRQAVRQRWLPLVTRAEERMAKERESLALEVLRENRLLARSR